MRSKWLHQALTNIFMVKLLDGIVMEITCNGGKDIRKQKKNTFLCLYAYNIVIYFTCCISLNKINGSLFPSV
jgi:hypothetical protein